MKRTGKVFAIVLAVAMVLSMASVAFADSQYTVVKGDWLSKIAPRYNTTWQKLAEYNKLKNPDLIFPGQIIKIPDGAPAANEAKLTGLKVDDISMKTALSGFSPDKTEYTVNVQDDIYGVRITPTAPAGAKVTVNGEELKNGSYILPIPQGLEDYFQTQNVKAAVKVEYKGASTTYNVNVVRKEVTDVYALFQEKSYKDTETGLTLPYELYVPSNYDASKKYPVVFVLHGAGQRLQPLYMLLARYQEATAWAVDSEKGHNECIVVSPQETAADGGGWTKFMQAYDKKLRTKEDIVADCGDPFELTDWGVAAHNLLHEVEKQYSVDTNRVYCTGLSMGGFGTYAMAVAHPEDFAAIAPVCGGLDPAKANVLAANNIAVWHTHAKDDTEVLWDGFGQQSIDAMKAAGVEYKTWIFEAGEIYYPGPHFAWTPAYANQEMRDWIFAHSKGENADLLTGLTVDDISMKTELKGFKASTHSYTVNVQDDIYGVRITPTAASGAKITVNGEELKNGSYILPIPQGLDDYFTDQKVTAVVKVVDGDKTGTYTVTVIREEVTDVYALFQEKSYKDAQTGLTLPYELYVPSDYDASKKYPVVFVLHGAGQRLQPLYMLLARYQEATAWAVDSEKGHNQCIVVSPQETAADGGGWTKFMQAYDKKLRTKADIVADVGDPFELTDWGIAAHNLLHEIEKQYSVDTNRVYCTGLSMGGFGTYAMAVAYPEDFAAIAPVCGGLDPAKASVLAKNNIAVWHTHAKDDTEVLWDGFGQQSIDAMKAAGVEYKTWIFEAGEIYYPGPHFAWTPAYANEEMRDWIFTHSK